MMWNTIKLRFLFIFLCGNLIFYKYKTNNNKKNKQGQSTLFKNCRSPEGGAMETKWAGEDFPPNKLLSSTQESINNLSVSHISIPQ